MYELNKIYTKISGVFLLPPSNKITQSKMYKLAAKINWVCDRLAWAVTLSFPVSVPSCVSKSKSIDLRSSAGPPSSKKVSKDANRRIRCPEEGPKRNLHHRDCRVPKHSEGSNDPSERIFGEMYWKVKYLY